MVGPAAGAGGAVGGAVLRRRGVACSVLSDGGEGVFEARFCYHVWYFVDVEWEIYRGVQFGCDVRVDGH